MSNVPVVHDFMVMAPVTGYIEYKINGVHVRVDPEKIEALHNTLLELFSTDAYGPEALRRLNEAIEDARLKEPVIPASAKIATMPVPRCETCKNWDKRNDYSGVCKYPRRELGAAKMWVDMYDDIITAPDFGCVQWEAK